MFNSTDVAIARTRTLVAAFVLSVAFAGCAPVTRDAPVKPDLTAAQPPASPTPANATPKGPTSLIAKSPDGTRIAYDTTGSGPTLILLHGGGQTRRSWEQAGYLARLSKRFTVISVDLRGSGDSDKPLGESAYALDTILADVLAVADAAGAKRFHVWGFGYGGTIGRYLAARSDRVVSAVVAGAPMGPTMTGMFKDAVTGMRAKWQPFLAAHAAKTLDLKTLSASDRSAWESGVPVSASALGAMMEYPPLEPADIKAPTLWVVGSDDTAAESAKGYEGKLAGTNVTLKMLSSVSYSDSFIRSDQVLGEVEPFLLKAPTSQGVMPGFAREPQANHRHGGGAG